VTAGRALPSLDLAAPPAAAPDPVASLVEQGLARFGPDGSVEFAPPAAAGTGDGSGWDGSRSGAPGAPDTVQRATDVAPPPPAHPAPGSAAAGAVGAAHDDAELDRLAGQLYDRIRHRLRGELRADRERAGFLTDISR